VTVRAYKYALNPTPRQARYLDGHCGAARKAFNWGLGRIKAVMDQRAAERSYGIPDELVTPAISWSMYSLLKAWNLAKATVAPWWAEYSKEAYASGWFPSSKTCSGCGVVKAKLLLSEREYRCESCGLVMDRDENAARNLAALAVAASGAETLNGRGADQKTRATGRVAVKRLPGSPVHETGTALPEAVSV
jgi:transposase